MTLYEVYTIYLCSKNVPAVTWLTVYRRRQVGTRAGNGRKQ